MPFPQYALRSAVTAGILWLLIRLAILFVGGGVVESLWSTVVVILLVVGLIWFDGHRFHEHLFHANLGSSPAWPVGISLFVAAGLEGAVRLTHAWIR
jgi:hypothetical protein